MFLFSFITENLLIVACQPNMALIGDSLNKYSSSFLQVLTYLPSQLYKCGFVLIGLD